MGIGGIQSHLHTWFYGPRLAKEMIYSGMRLPAPVACTRWDRSAASTPTSTRCTAETLAFAHDSRDSRTRSPLRQAKRAADTTMDIHGPALRRPAAWRSCST